MEIIKSKNLILVDSNSFSQDIDIQKYDVCVLHNYHGDLTHILRKNFKLRIIWFCDQDYLSKYKQSMHLFIRNIKNAY